VVVVVGRVGLMIQRHGSSVVVDVPVVVVVLVDDDVAVVVVPAAHVLLESVQSVTPVSPVKGSTPELTNKSPKRS